MLKLFRRTIHFAKNLRCEYNKTGGQLDKRRKALEEEYFHRQNKDLLRNIQKKKTDRISDHMKKNSQTSSEDKKKD